MSSSSARKCEPGCECGRHRRRTEVERRDDAPAPIPEVREVVRLDPEPVPESAVPESAVSVLVPARLDRQRRDLWEFLRPRWEKLGYEIVEGTCVGPWCKAAAVADALSRATGEILVVADADVWCDGVPAAVERVRSSAAWAMPHYWVRRLTLPATLEVLTSGVWPLVRQTTTFAERPGPGRPGGGMVVLSRTAYERVPLDPRFTGWGQEDESWALALGTVLGPMWRGRADLWHLWHDPAPRQSRAIGSQASMNLHRRYVVANRRPPRMAALLAEVRS